MMKMTSTTSPRVEEKSVTVTGVFRGAYGAIELQNRLSYEVQKHGIPEGVVPKITHEKEFDSDVYKWVWYETTFS